MDVVATPIDQGMIPMPSAITERPDVFGGSAVRRVAETRVSPAKCAFWPVTLSRLYA
jgi:hypothetical protein